MNRRDFFSLSTAGILGIPGISVAPDASNESSDPVRISDIAGAERISGLSFTDAQRELMLPDLQDRLESFAALRAMELPNELAPALRFDPRVGGMPLPIGRRLPTLPPATAPERETPVARPADADLAFMSIPELAHLLRARVVTSVDLTKLALARLDSIGRQLEAVVTLTTERALRAARRADTELANGTDRGLLHGIPYGAKDLLAVAGYPTTWGATPFKDQLIDRDATVVQKLDEAGAVLVAKLTLGALAWGDVWFGGKTRNPWNIDEGSSGSSAGPGAAVAAGLVPFAIGSETLGSIVSPSTRNGVTGFRPSFGLVPRGGAMTLSWTMDKLGPMARSATDCAIVFDAIRGADTSDADSIDAPFNFDYRTPPGELRVGYLAEAFEADYDNRDADRVTLDVVRSLGIEMTPIAFPSELPVDAINVTLSTEAAAAFDDLTRSGGVDAMVRQVRNAWPNSFRAARFVPAVEFLQANRARVALCRRMHETMQEFDVVISPSFGGGTLRITNLTGHPTVCVPNDFRPVDGFPERRSPRSISFVGQLYGDARALRLAAAVQARTTHHLRRPPNV